MKLTSLKLSSKEQEKIPEAVAVEKPSYPWGLGLHLDHDTLAKLGVGKLEVGKSLMIQARVNVTGAMEQEHEGSGGPQRTAQLQITDMGIGPDEGEGQSAADILYDGKG